MRVKAVSVLVLLFLCLSLVPMLLPQMVNPVNAMDSLTVTWTMTSSTPGNYRPHNLQTGDEVMQFGRPSFIVGTDPTGGLGAMHLDGTISGDFVGYGSDDWNSLSVWCSTWPDGTPPGTIEGYGIGKGEFYDLRGNHIEVIMAGDDLTPPPPSVGLLNSSFTGYVLSTSCTGPDFDGQVLIGTLSGSTISVNGVLVSQTRTINLRRYSAAEISGPLPMSGTATSTGVVPPFSSLGPSYGSQPDDEYIQFSRTDISMPLSTSAIYITGQEAIPMTFTGGLIGSGTTLAAGMVSLSATGQGWLASVNTIEGVGGSTLKSISLEDVLGPTADGTALRGYMFALVEDATGAYAGKDYYGLFDCTSNWVTGEVSLSGDVYTMTPAGGIPTATGTGLATLAPDSGSIENLTAVSATSPSTSLPPAAIASKPADVQFPHGLFEFRITGLADGESATLTITLPSAVPAGAQYWKYGPTPGNHTPHWYQIAMGDNDGDNVITITLVDGGLGDDDLTPNGTIVDQGGPGWPWPSGGSGGHSAPVFPSIYIGIGAALGAGILAYFVSRRLAAR